MNVLPSLFLNLALDTGEPSVVDGGGAVSTVDVAAVDAHTAWLRACGTHETTAPPPFKGWMWTTANDKRRFYQAVQFSENDRFSLGDYMMPYSPGKDVDALLRDEKWSIEHVLPRSRINGTEPGDAENDFFAWEPAYRGKNSSRGNLPLVLWPMPEETGVGRVDVETDGVIETHFNPVENVKARLARRWLYVRATYSSIDELDTPSLAQHAHKQDILDLVTNTRFDYAEERLNFRLSELTWNVFEQIWRNPLYLPERRKRFFSDPAWLALVFPPPVAPVATSPDTPQTAECLSI